MAGSSLGDIALLQRNLKFTQRELTIDASSTEQGDKIVEAIKSLPRVKVISYNDRTFAIHQGGKISVESKLPSPLTIRFSDGIYPRGVGRICRAIAEDPQQVYNLTVKGNTVAVVTDGSAVLGLGNLGCSSFFARNGRQSIAV